MLKFFPSEKAVKKIVDSSSFQEDEYEFTPVKNDQSDEYTQDLFEQLEEGATAYTNIYETVKSGANLYATKSYRYYENCYPIHIAAYNVGGNTEAIKLILETFDNPEERKKYIYLKDGTGRNALEILLIEQDEGLGESIIIPSIKAILSYLTAEEQRQLMSSLSEDAQNILNNDEADVSREEDIEDLAQLNYFFQQNKTIDMCRQRRKEESKALAEYESDEESLGKLDSVCNKKFTARVSYKEIVKDGVVVELIPELMLIPSDWRLDTAVEENNQGDHVTAYVLLLSSFSHCKGENIRNLPELVYKLAVDVLPEQKDFFLQKKQENKDLLDKYRSARVVTVASLKAECEKDASFVSVIENNLKKVEIESIARHIEDCIDHFIMIINKHEDESFSQKRKQSVTGSYTLQQLKVILEKIDFLNDKIYSKFRGILLSAITEEASKTDAKITDNTLKRIINAVRANDLNNIKIPKQLLSASNKLTIESFLEFLKKYTPFKKYHEGHAIRHIKEAISKLGKNTNPAIRNELLMNIGFFCFNLFDYPKVNDDKLNDEYVLYQAIPRHFIIIYSAFSYLKAITPNEKKIIYDTFLNNILMLQLWDGHLVLNKNNEEKPLNLNLLKERISEFANIDQEYNFCMKPEAQQPQHLHISDIKKEIPSSAKTVSTLRMGS